MIAVGRRSNTLSDHADEVLVGTSAGIEASTMTDTGSATPIA